MNSTDMKKPHVVLIPFPAQSHIKCMLKLAKLLHHMGINITFINTHSNHKLLEKSSGIHDLDGFHFKMVPDSPSSSTEDGVKHTAAIGAELWIYLKTTFFDSFLDLVSGLETPANCIVCDGFLSYLNMVAAEKLKIPLILFWTVAACGFMGVYQAKILMEKGIIPLTDESYLTNGYLDMEIDWIPGMEAIRLKDLWNFVRATKPTDPGLKYLRKTAEAADKVSHMIIHTFEELEARLVKELRMIFPNVYTIGPLQLLLNKETENSSFNGYSLWNEEPECVEWLQSKERDSVLYVNFGSLTVMSLQDLLEFGWGLVNSNHYFLWIVRTDLVDGKPVVLPQELEEAMCKKGFIASWCSQEEVLNHPSVGGFLTHGGWGSVIESLSAGVPMICCPFAGDQRTNCRQMFEEWEVGLEIERNVNRDVVEKVVRVLMEGAGGERMRKKALEWKKMAEMATGPNGSSYLDAKKLANQITGLSRS
ncbi:putative UDP-glucuronosyl/UDP-glucosyltransferase, UDP-glycosyltransferase family [Helianthus annuus]|nr:putative UDP-glucuronosyl/UDP-glucosyltransferase, UDP-glycosyltransferase family [Helianthus annuus]KAJ0749320.1 putative UDP-glucuronosyl/UDP-glucosyltransferase, UDP-glycosyltransferase family [Helianthus annuus]KAJ0921567.1 putative UDP-glucuronosyl/UDP-glucosyltransferase, UDP-glycosyltransferase family [Helianthus annuus]